MQFFLDSANLNDIAKWQDYGLVDGVTTNPALLAKEGVDPLTQLQKVAAAVNGPVSAQVTSRDVRKMIDQGRRLANVADNIVVKIPSTTDGIKVARSLKAEEIAINITLTFDPAQAIPFMRINADYISLIIGRVEDFGLDSMGVTAQLKSITRALGASSKILVASLRNSHHLIDAATNGADVLTVPAGTWANIYANPLTLGGESDFFRAWSALPAELRKDYEMTTDVEYLKAIKNAS